MATKKTDIAVTWPKKRSLEDYLDTLRRAEREGMVINYRVATLPKFDAGMLILGRANRCYIVHDGYVRGYNRIIWMGERDDVIDPVTEEFMAKGLFIQRDPRWCTLRKSVPMAGFQGWRYFHD